MSFFFRCFPKYQPRVEPHSETKTDWPYFPFLRIPVKVKHRVFDYLSPFDLISYSLCTDYTRNMVKVYRARRKFEKDCKLFKLCFYPQFQRIVLQFEERPNTYWQFIQNYEVCDRDWNPDKKVLDSVNVPTWTPEVTKTILLGSSVANEDTPAVTFHNIYFYSDYLVSVITKFFHYICELYNHPDRLLSLDMDCHFIDKLLTFYHENEPMEYWALQSAGTISDTLLRASFDRQNATKGMFFKCKASSKFIYDMSKLENIKERLDIYHCLWIKLTDVFELKSRNIALLGTKWYSEELRLLVTKWREGWNPKWKQIVIEFNLHCLNVAHCFAEESTMIPSIRNKKLIDVNSSVKLYKFKEIQRMRGRNFEINGFHIVRNDGEVATVYSTLQSIGVFSIQCKESDRFEFEFHRALYLPRGIWN
uniref:F-box domain-containing protein n=1 Tax=Caenorhabditis tropicalis TaxID=1561998 RepID=A0A1I7UW15_9PELO